MSKQYGQSTHDLAAAIRTKISGAEDADEAIRAILERTRNTNPEWTVNDIRDGLLEMAENVLVNPVTRGNPTGYIEQTDANDLFHGLTSTTQGTEFTKIARGENPGRQR